MKHFALLLLLSASALASNLSGTFNCNSTSPQNFTGGICFIPVDNGEFTFAPPSNLPFTVTMKNGVTTTIWNGPALGGIMDFDSTVGSFTALMTGGFIEGFRTTGACGLSCTNAWTFSFTYAGLWNNDYPARGNALLEITQHDAFGSVTIVPEKATIVPLLFVIPLLIKRLSLSPPPAAKTSDCA